jgi:hypothetical protein
MIDMAVKSGSALEKSLFSSITNSRAIIGIRHLLGRFIWLSADLIIRCFPITLGMECPCLLPVPSFLAAATNQARRTLLKRSQQPA